MAAEIARTVGGGEGCVALAVRSLIGGTALSFPWEWALSDVWLTLSDMGSITVRLHDDVEAALRRIAEERRLPVSAVLREAIEVWTNPRVVVAQDGKLVELDVQDQLERMERRLSRLEEMAGLG